MTGVLAGVVWRGSDETPGPGASAALVLILLAGLGGGPLHESLAWNVAVRG